MDVYLSWNAPRILKAHIDKLGYNNNSYNLRYRGSTKFIKKSYKKNLKLDEKLFDKKKAANIISVAKLKGENPNDLLSGIDYELETYGKIYQLYQKN